MLINQALSLISLILMKAYRVDLPLANISYAICRGNCRYSLYFPIDIVIPLNFTEEVISKVVNHQIVRLCGKGESEYDRKSNARCIK